MRAGLVPRWGLFPADLGGEMHIAVGAFGTEPDQLVTRLVVAVEEES
ncbi:hypothetical protein Ade02nite_57830 [Paractinoplanes deccanensis]|uniref:Uncharacterized protein n=1 Tax=Paractinoplanes deccanensis TaxID=113561 RepID=A0ABQ3YB00_9ACTN|nr:hypothetical protein Ade02nite_57830 [Actinoplanes deccanensis]